MINHASSYKSIPSFDGVEQIDALYELIVEHAPVGSILVELGNYHGRSLVHMGLRAKESGKSLRVVGIDHDEQMSQGLSRSLLATIQSYHLSSVVSLVISDSVKAAKIFEDESVWFVFVDAAHTPHEAPAADIKAWMPKIRRDGFLAGHDYKWHTVVEPLHALVPVVMHEQEWPDCWLAPKQSLILDANIRTPTTIPKDPNSPTIRDYFKGRS